LKRSQFDILLTWQSKSEADKRTFNPYR